MTPGEPAHSEPANGPPAPTVHVPPGTPCIKCQYDLAGLRFGDNCPECGEHIEPEAVDAAFTVVHLSCLPARVAKRLRLAMVLVIVGDLAWSAIFALTMVGPFTGMLQHDTKRWLAFGAILVSTVGWWGLLQIESRSTSRFVPVLCPESASLMFLLRAVATSLGLAFVLMWSSSLSVDSPNLTGFLLLAIAAVGAHCLLVPLQYNLVHERTRRLRRSARPGVHGCFVAILLAVAFAVLLPLVDGLVRASCAITPIVLALWLIVVHISLRRAAGQQ